MDYHSAMRRNKLFTCITGVNPQNIVIKIALHKTVHTL